MWAELGSYSEGKRIRPLLPGVCNDVDDDARNAFCACSAAGFYVMATDMHSLPLPMCERKMSAVLQRQRSGGNVRSRTRQPEV